VGRRKCAPFKPKSDQILLNLLSQYRAVKRIVAQSQNRIKYGDGIVDLFQLRRNMRACFRYRTQIRASRTRLKRAANSRFLRNAVTAKVPYTNLYRLVKSEKRADMNIKMLKDENGTVLSSPVAIKLEIEKYWTSIFTNVLPAVDFVELQRSFCLRAAIPLSEATTSDRDLELWELEKALRQLKSNASAGPSDIPPALFRHLGMDGKLLLLSLFQAWWEAEFFPEEGQVASVTLLYKGGDLHRLQSYRTLSLTCTLCKIYLRIISNRMYLISEKFAILGETQMGFRQGRRCTDNLLILSTLVKTLRLEKKNGFLAFLDIKKAYDRVDREILYSKLSLMGFSRKIVSVIKATYSNPLSTLIFDREQPPITGLRMDIGLRQGCVMSCLLFLLYIADMIQTLSVLPVGPSLDFVWGQHIYSNQVNNLVFADDLMLIAVNEAELSRLLGALATTSRLSRLEFSCQKSQVIPLGRVPKVNKVWKGLLESGEVIFELREYQQAKYLGVIVCRKTDIFATQKFDLISKARKTMWALWKVAATTGTRNVFGSLVWGCYGLPAILYGTESMALSDTLLGSLQTIQNRYFKLCLGLSRQTSSAAIMLYTGVCAMQDEYAKRLLNYYLYVVSLGPQRLVWQAASQQKMWSYGDTRCWFSRIRRSFITYDLWDDFRRDPLIFSTMTKFAIKTLVRRTAEDRMWSRLNDSPKTAHIEYRPWVIDKTVTTENNSIFWLKLKMVGFPFPIRDHGTQLPLCPLCRAGEDTWVHLLLHCEEADAVVGSSPDWSRVFSVLYKNTEVETDYIAWFLAEEATPAVKYERGSKIRTRFALRFTNI